LISILWMNIAAPSQVTGSNKYLRGSIFYFSRLR
jgi:hypothetical protein